MPDIPVGLLAAAYDAGVDAARESIVEALREMADRIATEFRPAEPEQVRQVVLFLADTIELAPPEPNKQKATEDPS